MANTTILLREDIDNVGGRGEIVKVKAGFARNFLLPRVSRHSQPRAT